LEVAGIKMSFDLNLELSQDQVLEKCLVRLFLLLFVPVFVFHTYILPPSHNLHPLSKNKKSLNLCCVAVGCLRLQVGLTPHVNECMKACDWLSVSIHAYICGNFPPLHI
jgi:uncharacterized membrane protein